MNNTFPYEQLIASKLEQLPAMPELADGIWQRINTALDEELPSDDDDFNHPDHDPDDDGGGTVPGNFIPWMLLVTAAVVALFWMFNKKADKSAEQVKAPITIDSSAGTVSAVERVADDSSEMAPSPQLIQVVSDSTARMPIVAVPAIADSVMEQSSLPPPLPDSLVQIANDSTAPVQTVPDSVPVVADTSKGRKRPSGIKGVNSNDYRIVPQKDKKDSL